MKSFIDFLDPRPLYSSDQAKPTLILLLSALIPTIHKYFGSMEFALNTLSLSNSLYASIYLFLGAFILMGILPVFIIVLLFREPLRDYGVRIGNWKLGLPIVIVYALIIVFAILFPASQTSEMRNFYPLDKFAGISVGHFITHQGWRVIFFYSAWEFFFRGFMLFGLRKPFGNWSAICIQVIPSCLWHIGMPIGEIFASIIAGILFGLIAIRTGSILWPFLLHCLIGISLDLLIIVTG